MGQPVLNLNYLFETIVKRIKPLDFETLRHSPIPLKASKASYAYAVLAACVSIAYHIMLDSLVSRRYTAGMMSKLRCIYVCICMLKDAHFTMSNGDNNLIYLFP